MRQSVAKSLRASVYRYCAQIAHPNPKRIYRRVKKAFLSTPRNLRHRFDPATGTVV